MDDKLKRYNKKNHLLKIFLVILLFWLILSGIFSMPLIILGLASTVFVLYIVNRMDLVDHEVSLHNFNAIALISYFFWLIKEIIISNLKVCICILTPGNTTKPETINIKSSQKSELAHTIYANSITLTPGTVTIDIKDNILVVHTLDKKFKDSLESGEMDKKLYKTEILIEDKENKID